MRGTPYFFKNYLTGTQPVTQKGRNYRLYRNCQKLCSIYGNDTVTPAKAGIPILDSGSCSGRLSEPGRNDERESRRGSWVFPSYLSKWTLFLATALSTYSAEYPADLTLTKLSIVKV